jgi:hypothetical protein
LGQLRSIFLSHNCRDKSFVRRLARDLTSQGIHCWIDEAEIMIGDSLISKIQEGIMGSEYLAVILSPHSVKSTWVKKELEMAFSMEVNNRKVKILPLLVQDCEIPLFLKDKLYADFRTSYNNGLNVLLNRFMPRTIYPKLDWQKADDTMSENGFTWVLFMDSDFEVIYKKRLPIESTIGTIRKMNPIKGGLICIKIKFDDLKLFKFLELFSEKKSDLTLSYHFDVDSLILNANNDEKMLDKIAHQVSREIWARDARIMSIFGVDELAVTWEGLGDTPPPPVSADCTVGYFIDCMAGLQVRFKSKLRSAYDTISLKTIYENANNMSSIVQEVLKCIKENG